MAEHDMQPHQETWALVTRLMTYGILGVVALLGILAIWLIATG